MNKTSSIRNVVANNVKKYRKLNNLTQEALAELAEISNTYIANIECGQTWVSDKTLEKIALALHIDIYLLFIPDCNISEKTVETDSIQKKLSYISSRKEELTSYINDFLSETFSQIL